MPNYILKVLFVGDEWFELRNLLGENYFNLFSSRTMNTIGCEFGLVSVNSDPNFFTLQLWDFSSEERFRLLRPSYYRGGKIAILAFDFRRSESFSPRIHNLIQDVYSSTGPIPIIILGCNADLEAEHQVTREEINELIDQDSYYSFFELNSNGEGFNAILGRATILAIESAGIQAEYREPVVEEIAQIRERVRQNVLAKKERLKKFITILEEMKYHVDDKYQVDILTQRGLFTVNVKGGTVLFEPNFCKSCLRGTCKTRESDQGKPLCIVSEGRGWSNIELDSGQLLVLSKIIAIAEDNLPDHVLDQMKNMCPGPINDEVDLSEGLYEQISLQITPMEASTMLRNTEIQYREGRLPHYVYISLKEKYERIITIH